MNIELSQLRTICESLEGKARGFELHAEQQAPREGQKMAMSAESQLKWAAAYRRAAAIIRDHLATDTSG